jgi:hypothetical protein
MKMMKIVMTNCTTHVAHWPKLFLKILEHRRMARGGHGLPKVSPGPTMPDHSTPNRWTTPETA